ncbi:MAG: riboflavin synthase [Candidatus Poriferisodalaceae bacterium]|jgi:riboflavin synthase|tara:strand:- start:2341 stop:2919 length:579 start_codon:yes stop_codon:yes gene_type:complete
MFTGLIEELGSFLYREGERFRFEAELVLEETKIDDSISVNGCCLTVVDIGDDWWEADAVEETVSRTSLGDLVPGDSINLERAVRSIDRLGGHMVQGHVDGVGTIISPGPDLRVRMPKEMARYLVEKGSITVDGVSLTCFDVLDDSFAIALIPHTMNVTSLGSRNVGDRVNLEVDVIAKYVERLLIPHNGEVK